MLLLVIDVLVIKFQSPLHLKKKIETELTLIKLNLQHAIIKMRKNNHDNPIWRTEESKKVTVFT